jgi:neutral ceramidase
MAGFAKKEMDCFFPGLGMMGYGQSHNIVESQATPLFVRAAAFRDEQHNHFIFMNVELAFATIAVKEALTERLQSELPELKLSLANIMLTSQHTHSAPGGYSHYPFYNFTIRGFQPKLFNNIVSACVDAAKEAIDSLSPSRISWGSFEIPLDQNVAFNRSMTAYVRNPEAKTKESKEAVNREMQGLNIYDLQGKLRAHLNWFGVHATSISSYNTKIHHDNKGVAASLLESKKNIFAIFAQEAAGDVSPNFVWDKKLKRMCGPTEDQYKNAALNGQIQADSAEKIKDKIPVNGSIKCTHAYFDVPLKAAKAAHGLGFFKGTLEGPGLPEFLSPVLKFIANTAKELSLLFNPEKHVAFFHAHGNKHILLDNRDGTIFGLPKRLWQKIPIPATGATGDLFPLLRAGALETLPWVPEILPFQIVHLGNVTIIGIAGEITTVASARLKSAMSQKFPAQIIIISSYANAYMGYITTPEEYDEQCYEGGHCIYGRRTLNAFIEYFCDLADAPFEVSTKSFQFPAQELAKRTQHS